MNENATAVEFVTIISDKSSDLIITSVIRVWNSLASRLLLRRWCRFTASFIHLFIRGFVLGLISNISSHSDNEGTVVYTSSYSDLYVCTTRHNTTGKGKFKSLRHLRDVHCKSITNDRKIWYSCSRAHVEKSVCDSLCQRLESVCGSRREILRLRPSQSSYWRRIKTLHNRLVMSSSTLHVIRAKKSSVCGTVMVN